MTRTHPRALRSRGTPRCGGAPTRRRATGCARSRDVGREVRGAADAAHDALDGGEERAIERREPTGVAQGARAGEVQIADVQPGRIGVLGARLDVAGEGFVGDVHLGPCRACLGDGALKCRPAHARALRRVARRARRRSSGKRLRKLHAGGQREPVIGYEPQVARSGGGFITGLLLPKGNAADSGQLVPMVDEVVCAWALRKPARSVLPAGVGLRVEDAPRLGAKDRSPRSGGPRGGRRAEPARAAPARPPLVRDHAACAQPHPCTPAHACRRSPPRSSRPALAPSRVAAQPAQAEGAPTAAPHAPAPAVAKPAPGAPAPAPPRPLEVTVSGEHPPGALSLSRAEVRQLPGAFGDPFRAIEMRCRGSRRSPRASPSSTCAGRRRATSATSSTASASRISTTSALGPSVIAPRPSSIASTCTRAATPRVRAIRGQASSPARPRAARRFSTARPTSASSTPARSSSRRSRSSARSRW